MNLREIIIKILPFLFSAIEKEWNKLPDKTKEVLIQSGKVGQLLKLYYAAGYDEFIKVVAEKLALDKKQVDEILMALAKKLGWNINAPNELFDKLQAKIDEGLEDSAWDNLWTSIAGQLHIIFAGGRLNWPQLALGLIQFIYDKFIKKSVLAD